MSEESYVFDSELDTLELEPNTSVSELLDLALDTSTHEWRESFKEIFNNPTDRVPVSIWNYVMKCRRDENGLEKGAQGRKVHYVKVDARGSILQHHAHERRSDSFRTQHASVSSISMPWFFPQCCQATIDVVDRRTQIELQGLFNRTNSTEIQQDLELMWDGNIFSDVLVSFPFSEDTEEGRRDNAALFSGHQFVLKARSSYFRDILHGAVVNGPTQPTVVTAAEQTPLVFLPWSTVEPPIWEVVFRFIYTGKFQFQHSPQNFSKDLSTVISIYRASVLVQLQSLKTIVYHVIIDMLHGLFHAPMSPVHYDQLIRGVWTNMTQLGGCNCLQCAHHVPIVLQLSLERGFEDPALERGARRALVGMFGLGWRTNEFSALPASVLNTVLADFRKAITPPNIFAMIFAVESAIVTAGEKVDSGPMSFLLLNIEKVLTLNFLACFDCAEWEQMSKLSSWEIPRERAENKQKLEWIMNSVLKLVRPLDSAGRQQTLKPFTLVRQQLSSKDPELVDIWSKEIFRLNRYLMDPVTTETSNRNAPTVSPIPLIPSDASDEGVETTEPMQALPLTMLPSASSSEISLVSYTTAPEIHDIYSGGHNMSLQTIESFQYSFSNASSRTVSTDYGTFYRRMGISEDLTHDLNHPL